MKKSYRIAVDCANCARKIEENVRAMEGVQSIRINFMTLRMTLEAPDDRFDEVLKNVIAKGKAVDSDFEVLI